MPVRWLMRADPCTVCRSESSPHSCGISVVQPVTVILTHTDAGTFVAAFPCAFSRAIRDA